MAIFKQKNGEHGAPEGGQKFLGSAKETLLAVFGEYAGRVEEYDTIEAFSEALFADTWQETEQLLKRSFANGRQFARGRVKRS